MPTPARVTVVEKVFYECEGQSPASIDHSYDRTLASVEQPVTRVLVVGEQWQVLNPLWLPPQGVGLLMLYNHPPGATDPAEMVAGHVVEVAFISPAAQPSKSRTMWDPPLEKQVPPAQLIVHPGRDMRVEPIDVSMIRIRCRRGETRCTLTMLPA